MRKGWFRFTDQDGDRTLEQQLVGLESIPWHGKSVLDLGCAEGLISKHAAQAGARWVHGVDILPSHVERARKECDCYPCSFEVANLNDPIIFGPHDIVLMLGILHKLRDPCAAAARYARYARELIVIRFPPGEAPWIISDRRSGHVRHDVSEPLSKAGWSLSLTRRGTFDEFTGIWRKA